MSHPDNADTCSSLTKLEKNLKMLFSELLFLTATVFHFPKILVNAILHV